MIPLPEENGTDGEETAEKMAFPVSQKLGSHNQAIYKVRGEIRSEATWGQMPALLFIT